MVFKFKYMTKYSYYLIWLLTSFLTLGNTYSIIIYVLVFIIMPIQGRYTLYFLHIHVCSYCYIISFSATLRAQMHNV